MYSFAIYIGKEWWSSLLLRVHFQKQHNLRYLITSEMNKETTHHDEGFPHQFPDHPGWQGPGAFRRLRHSNQLIIRPRVHFLNNRTHWINLRPARVRRVLSHLNQNIIALHLTWVEFIMNHAIHKGNVNLITYWFVWWVRFVWRNLESFLWRSTNVGPSETLRWMTRCVKYTC